MSLALLAACGGGGGSNDTPPAEPPPAAVGQPSVSSGASPMAADCTGDTLGNRTGTAYLGAEVEPMLAVHPANPQHLVGAWQQDRWSDGGARGVTTGVSFDGGRSWERTLLPFSRCAGGPYERATDPWVDIGPDGTVHAMALAFDGASLTPGSASAMLAVRSTDGGRTWSAPATLVRDGATLFNDKNALTADATDARYVYAVWDRLDTEGRGPTLFARSTDGGLSWEPARVIHTPTSAGISQTIGNRIVVLPNGRLLNVFTQIDTLDGRASAHIAVQASDDKGLQWGEPITVAQAQGVGARDAQSGQAIRDGVLLPAVAVGRDGVVWVAWQDARFSGGAHDAIALSRSTDGGRQWSPPVAVNRRLDVAAFLPTLATHADGTVALLYLDLRADTRASATVASSWLLTSRDGGATWRESAVLPPFDMARAPLARGLFLGDYFGLVAADAGFVALLSVATGNFTDRSDILAVRLALADVASAEQVATTALPAAPGARETAQLR